MRLIANLPTVTAGMSFAPTIRMHQNGYSIANTNFVIQCAAHLYAACRSTKSIRDDLHWRDMDQFLKLHNLTTDTPPTADPYTMVNHFYLALGDRLSTIAKAKANTGRKDFRTRWIEVKSDFLKSYASVAEGAEKKNGGEEVTVVDGMLEALAQCFDSELQHKSAKHKQKNNTPIELLSVFKRILTDDELERNFNMIGFSQQCSNFLSEIRAQLNNSGPGYLNSWAPIDSTAAILLDASRLMTEGRPVSGPGTSMATVSMILEDMVENSGEKYVKDAQTWSSV